MAMSYESESTRSKLDLENTKQNFSFSVQCKDTTEIGVLTYAQLEDTAQTGPLIELLFEPCIVYPSPFHKNMRIGLIHALHRNFRTKYNPGTRSYEFTINMIGILGMTEKELLALKIVGPKSVQFFMEATRPLRQSLTKAGLIIPQPTLLPQ